MVIKAEKGPVFKKDDGTALYDTWLDQQQPDVRAALGYSDDFVLHSLRHTFGTRLSETGADAFTIMRLMGHSSITVSQRYVHPASDAMKATIERMGEESKVPANSPTPLKVVKGKKRVSA